ncbi:unnamed protein product [Ectocarpus sp. CCAP 1310/34]|nr:unnamed protein product [Ectocarpus sp. CCAP 1310/34]
MAVLREQATQLGLKHERYKTATRLNEEISAEVDALLRKMEQRTKTHGEEVHAIRQEVLHLRQQLESTFRKTLKDLGGTYRRKVTNASSHPGVDQRSVALKENIAKAPL